MNIVVQSARKYRWPKMKWVADALIRLGHEVRGARDLDNVLKMDDWADFVLFQHRFQVDGRFLVRHRAKAKAPWVVWWFDALMTDPTLPYEKQHYLQDETCVAGLEQYDLVLVKERGVVQHLNDRGINAAYLDQACPSDYPATIHSGSAKYDLVLFGVIDRTHKTRTLDMRTLHEAGFKMLWIGDGAGTLVPSAVDFVSPRVMPHELPDLCSRAKVVLAVDACNGQEGYTSDRLWLALGMGACMLRRKTPGQPVSYLYDSYETDGELVTKARRLTSDSADAAAYRTSTGLRARQVVMSQHTYEHRCEELVKLCSSLKRR